MSGPLPPLLLKGDCLVELARILDESVDAVVTDPPYGLEAAYLEGFESIGVEMTADYWPLIAARIERVTA